MPNHGHLLDPSSADEVRLAVGALASGYARRLGMPRVFEPLPDPAPIPDALHLARQIRYVHLNPCRARLVADPLAWPYSTHRGIVGAEVNPWVGAARLAEQLGERARGYAEAFHAYVSSDPSASVAGTPFPRAAARRGIPAVPLESVIRAAFSAAPFATRAHRRHLIAALARAQGWTDLALLSKALGVHPDTARRLRLLPEPPGLDAALLCLGDARLLLGLDHCLALRALARSR
jgi:hypothetical protein